MSRIAFVNPAYGPGHFSRASRSPAVAKSATVYYPMWLCYAAGWAESRGHDVSILDAAAALLPHGDVVRSLLEKRPDVVVLDTTTPSIASDLRLAELVRDALPSAKIVAVGTHASACPEAVLGSCPALDAVGVGEYDQSIEEYASASDPSGVPGLVSRDGGKPTRYAAREPMDDLDRLPFVTRVYKEHLDVRDYFFSTARHPMVMTITGRGCPNRCSWCLYPQTMHGRRYRVRSPENVVDEFEYVSKELPGVREIGVEDDTFTARRSRAREICELILRRGPKVRWWANVRADLDYETMRLMKRAGCRLFIVGFESGSQDVLDRIHKGIRLDQAETFMASARKLRVSVRACFVVGQPGETIESMNRTLRYAIRLNPDTAQFFPMIVYPGTEAFETARGCGWLTTDDFSEWLTEKGTHNYVLKTGELTPEAVNDFVSHATRAFYLRPRVVLRTALGMATSWQELRRVLHVIRRFAGFLAG